MRDLRAIGNKVVQVLYPQSDNAVLRDWDLWGPLLVSLLSSSSPSHPHLLTNARYSAVLSDTCYPTLDKW